MKNLNMKNYIMVNYMIGNFMFSLNRKHLLIILLSLELIMMNMFLLIFNYMVVTMSIYFMMMFMILTVCEGVLGLSVLVYLIRMFGNDYIKIFSLL